jgi:beta-hydroxylase
MRGVYDLYGIKGYWFLARWSLMVALVGVCGAGIAFLENTLATIFMIGCMSVLVSLIAMYSLRGLSAELQRLNTEIWVGIDYGYQWLVRSTIVATGVSLVLLSASVLSTTHEPFWKMAQLLVIASWTAVFGAAMLLFFASVRIGRQINRITRWLLEQAVKDGQERIASGLRSFLSIEQKNPFQITRGVSMYSGPSSPFHDASDFPFLKTLEDNYETIRSELEKVLNSGGAGFQTYRYGSVGGQGWDTFHFHRGKERITENTSRCPETTRIIESIPGFFTRHSVFSLLRPGASAAPHRDYGDLTLNCHLGLIVPTGDCRIRLGSETRSWGEGKLLVFDTSYEHEVWNRCDSLRVVLQVTFFKKELTEAEKIWWSKYRFRRTYP